MYQHDKHHTARRGETGEVGLQSKQRVKFASQSGWSNGRCLSRLQNNKKHGISRALHSAPSGQLQGLDLLPNQPPVPESVEDSHILVKHSADPYVDFKNSMLHMIWEEKLQVFAYL